MKTFMTFVLFILAANVFAEDMVVQTCGIDLKVNLEVNDGSLSLVSEYIDMNGRTGHEKLKGKVGIESVMSVANVRIYQQALADKFNVSANIQEGYFYQVKKRFTKEEIGVITVLTDSSDTKYIILEKGEAIYLGSTKACSEN